MDPLFALMSPEGMDENKLRALADQMRKSSATGAALSTSTIAPVANQGRLMQTQASQQAMNIGLQQARDRALKSKEATSLIKAMGSGRKGYGSKIPADTHAQKFEDEVSKRMKHSTIANRWKPEYQGVLGFGGDIENWLARTFKVGDPAQAEFWSDWKSMHEIAEKHAYYGAALTPTEERNFRSSTISANDSPEFVESKIRTAQLLLNKVNAKDAQNKLSRGWDPDYVAQVYGDALPQAFWADPEEYIRGLTNAMKDTDLTKDPAKSGGGSVRDLSDEELMERIRGLQ